MKRQLKILFIQGICFFFFTGQCFAANNLLNTSLLSSSAGHDFISGAQPGDVLIKVNLWGAVHKPGIHRIPSKTDLLTLMSYAGGPTDRAILDEVTIKRRTSQAQKLIKVDLEELVQGASHHNVELAPDDVIIVPADKPLISNDTLAVVGVASIILSTILTAVIIDDRTKD